MVILPMLLLIMLVQFGSPGCPHPFYCWEVSVGHIEYNGGQGFNVVFGQSESLYFGEFVLGPHVRDDLAQGLEGVVELVHPLPLALVALQPPQQPVLAAPSTPASAWGALAALLVSPIPPLFAPQTFHQFLFSHCWLFGKRFFVNSLPLSLSFGFSLHVLLDGLVLIVNVL